MFVTRNKHIFRRSCPLSLPFLGQETSDVAETGKPGTEKAGTVVFYVFFPVSLFFQQGHFPTQVFTCQEEIQTSYGHRCGHIWSQYGVLRFMGIELRMWYYDKVINRPFSARDMKLRMGLECGVYLTLFCLNPACQLRRTT